jgi:predicted dehydrogenase
MVKVAIIGFGGIANGAHFPAYKKLEAEGVAKVVAVCDVDENRFGGSVAINIGNSDDSLERDFAPYTDWRTMLENEDVDMVDICVPSFLHADIACGVLEMGYDVLSEKPMALDYETCLKMIETQKKSGKQLMIGQCLRFGANYAMI